VPTPKVGDRRHRAMPAPGKLTLRREEPERPTSTRTVARVDDREVRGAHPRRNPREVGVVKPLLAVRDNRGGAASAAVPKARGDRHGLSRKSTYYYSPLHPRAPRGMVTSDPKPGMTCCPLIYDRVSVAPARVVQVDHSRRPEAGSDLAQIL
jgi:hypothetical protein